MSFEPFSDYQASPEQVREFQTLERQDNLVRRYAYFQQQNGPLTEQRLGFVPLVIENRFTCVAVPGAENMACSVGFWYNFWSPELMLVGQVPMKSMHRTIEVMGAMLEDGNQQAYRQDPGGYLQARMKKMASVLGACLRELGLTTQALVPADDDFLDRHPYGYGGYFYAHFLDDPWSVPLVKAELTALPG
ncbi:MAG: hypothetical protein AB7S38_23260 [Vulcanimicrobiota bacterium]